MKLFATHPYCLIAKCANDNVLFMRAPDSVLANMDGPFLSDNIRGMPSAVFPFVNGVYSVTVEEWGDDEEYEIRIRNVVPVYNP